ncbi:hypothetical protein [Paraburkholderia sacchari]|uniref:hypothetical protein n=1 Tax=Paraburkholderia sacchari TaxID=159450 RepID=UPI0039A6CDE6
MLTARRTTKLPCEAAQNDMDHFRTEFAGTHQSPVHPAFRELARTRKRHTACLAHARMADTENGAVCDDTLAEYSAGPAAVPPLREPGCDAIQGYLISRPMPACEVAQWQFRADAA